jgi:hypothetical protein
MQNPNALFMLRDSAVMNDIPEQYLTRFKDLEPLQVLHLQVSSLLRGGSNFHGNFGQKVGIYHVTTLRLPKLNTLSGNIAFEPVFVSSPVT